MTDSNNSLLEAGKCDLIMSTINQESISFDEHNAKLLLDLETLIEFHRSKTSPNLILVHGMSQEVAVALGEAGIKLDLLFNAANPTTKTAEYFEDIIRDFGDKEFKLKIDHHLMSLTKKNSYGLPAYNDMLWQQAIIETGFVYTRSPFSGKSLRSNKSFVLSKKCIIGKSNSDHPSKACDRPKQTSSPTPAKDSSRYATIR